jgi:DNA-binding beta-propeller fold protein YncE
MRSKRRFKISSIPNWLTAAFLGSALFWSSIAAGAATELKVSYLYTLSDFYGPLPYNWARLAIDYDHDEIYVVDRRERDVTVFNAMGMEVYRFGGDGSLGGVIDVAVKKDGRILVLSKRSLETVVLVCDFRGEPQSEIVLKNFPPDFAGFSPDRMVYQADRLYLLDMAAMLLAVTDAGGLFRNGYDLGALVGAADAEKRAATEIGGFSVDRQGNMLFTIPVLFAAYRLSPDGKLRGFGQAGSSPGRFNIVGGIVADDQGYYYVADRLKSAVIIFDKDFNFQREFGFRGFRPENLIGPRQLALDARGHLYVSQLRGKGVSVFKIDHDQP